MPHDALARQKRIPTILLTVSAFALTPFLFCPARIYLGNFMEFTSLFRESALFFLLLSLGLMTVLSAALLILSRRLSAFRTAVSILCAFAFLLWLQGNVIVWQYGVLDGRDIAWGALVHCGVIDALVWAGLLAFAVVKAGAVFRFYHLNGIHLQLIMNENLEYEPLAPFRGGMLRQGTGVLKITALFLERLKRLGVFDNSLIFIVGDHGSGVGDVLVNVSPLSAQFNRGRPYRGNFNAFKAAGIPLVLVKRINAAGALRISDAPVCLGDIPRTVAKELGLDEEFPGRSMFRVKEGEPRERIYRAFVGPQEEVVYLAPLYEYAVNGFSWDDASWRETGNVYYAKP